jgi:hypothetical protein
MWRVKTYLRLARLAFDLLWRSGSADPRDDAQLVLSEVEAIHCALGHGYNRDVILPTHEPLMRAEAWGFQCTRRPPAS